VVVKAGDRAYFVAHPYYHFLGEVVEVLGMRRVALRNVVQVHSDSRGWTQFFAQGVGTQTKYDIIGDSPDVGYLFCHAWPHPIPTEKRP
jgi:hypothetical protein